MQEYDSKCLKMYHITLKVFKMFLKIFAPITKVNEGESNTPCPSTLEVTYTSVETLSKALQCLWLNFDKMCRVYYILLMSFPEICLLL
jgi:hypothetical protein